MPSLGRTVSIDAGPDPLKPTFPARMCHKGADEARPMVEAPPNAAEKYCTAFWCQNLEDTVTLSSAAFSIPQCIVTRLLLGSATSKQSWKISREHLVFAICLHLDTDL